ncbi:hypothetical protein [Rhizobium alvei]|uniref:Transmembrane protein n=1 Tax=Rhizobium alvei TaxID=1132659 RepID=A0ABT8YL66_9HYPH|nr:hypothetical protein [Rhizobium alvei]MDO6964456.1 hypothetical protein [Rhizobium alvei]
MADFVAVIRRAVDGLTDNTPEARARVYERARSTVIRQLENMKPQPPEAMLQRQIDKLDAAIRQVEEENGEALPADTAEPVAAAPVAVVAEPVASSVSEPVEPEPVAQEPEPAPFVAEPEQAAVDEPSPEAHAYSEPERVAEPEPVFEPEPVVASEPEAAEAPATGWDSEPEATHVEEPVQPAVTEDHYQEPAHVEPEPVWSHHHDDHTVRSDIAAADHWQQEQTPAPAEADVPLHAADEPADEPEAFEPQHPAEVQVEEPVPYDPLDAFLTAPASASMPEPVPAVIEPVVVEPVAAEPVVAETVAPYWPEDPVPAPEPEIVPEPEEEPYNPFDLQPQQPSASAPAPEPELYVSHETLASDPWAIEPPTAFEPAADEPQMPKVPMNEQDVVAGFNEFIRDEFSEPAVPPPPGKKTQDDGFSWDAPFDDLPELPAPVAFEEALAAKQSEIATNTKQERQKQRRKNRNARAELEQLIGAESARKDAPSTSSAATPAIAEGAAVPPEARKAVSKLEGKSYRVQKSRPQSGVSPLALSLGIVGLLLVSGAGFAAWQYSDQISAFVTNLTSGSATPPVKPADDAAKTPTATDKPATDMADNATDAAKATEPTTPADASVPSKFTQRLLPDGTEKDDPTAVSVDKALPEGKTVAGQTEVAQNVPAAEEKPATTDTTQAPAVATQKMFLYEERLGQTSPVAVMGSVNWREKNEAQTEKGTPEPAVVAQLEVPGRKMKVLVTFNRNTDASLPASHFIEVIFDLPKDFEEGSIENVQRITFKQTEQDRGNALIGVPVKVTDDYHMIALNDEPNAIKTNLDLMKTRSWIDIPITYRNGRRALITIEKGATGAAVFDKVLAEWAALGDAKKN